MNIAIIGSRDYPTVSYKFITYLIGALTEHEEITIGSGGALGVDTFAITTAKMHKLKTVLIRPNYARYGPQIAPLKRNEILMNWADCVFAFWSQTPESTGTLHACNFARKHGISTRVFGADGSLLDPDLWIR